jgi:glycosyltransferase involved in cell wall biosynthesis
VPILDWLFRNSVRCSDGVSGVSEPLKEHVINKYHRTKHVEIVTNAVNRKEFYQRDKTKSRKRLGLPKNATIICAAGDLSQHRGSDIIFQSIENDSKLPHNVHIVVCGHRTSDTTIPKSNRIHDLGQLPISEVPIFLSALDLAIIYNRESLFGDYCFPRKLYEMLACQCPIIAANVGVIVTILKNKPHLLYSDGDIEEFVNAVKLQLASQIGKHRLITCIDICNH